MAIPPPHAFINVIAARMLDATTIELSFEHPGCQDPTVLFVEAFWEEAGPAADQGSFALGLFERRQRHGVPVCTGPMAIQRGQWPLPPLLPDDRIRRGHLVLNSDSLYGRHRHLPRYTLAFDLDGAAGGPARTSGSGGMS